MVHPLVESNTQSPCRRGTNPFLMISKIAEHECDKTSSLFFVHHVPQGFQLMETRYIIYVYILIKRYEVMVRNMATYNCYLQILQLLEFQHR